MSKAIVNMTPNPSDIQTIHCSQGDTEAREWEFELHNNGEVIDAGGITEQMVFKSYKGGTEQILPENGAVPVTAPFVGDIKYHDVTRNDQEFLYRQSPTEKDGNAKIKSLYGNTLVWNQILKNGNFENTSLWGSVRGTIAVSNNILSYTSSQIGGGSVQNRITRNDSFAGGHKYLLSVECKPAHATTLTVQFRQGTDIYKLTDVSAVWSRNAFIFEPTNAVTEIFIGLAETASNGYVVGDVDQYRNIQVFDLTQMGLDSLTAEQFTSLFSKPYYDYCQGAMLSFGGRNVKFNQIVQNGNFADSSLWSGQSTTILISNGIANVTLSAKGNYVALRQSILASVTGHKYFVTATFKSAKKTAVGFYLNGQYAYTTGYDVQANTQTIVSSLIDGGSSGGFNIYVSRKNELEIGDVVQVSNVMLVDLTEMFGAGNEPSAEGFLELFPNNYYEYTTEKYMNIGQPVGLKVSGSNLCTRTTQSNIYNAGNLIPVKSGDVIYYGGVWTGTGSMWGAVYASKDETNKNNYLKGYNLVRSDNITSVTIDRDGFFGLAYGGGVGTYNVEKMMISFAPFTMDEYVDYIEPSTLSIPLDEFPNGMDGINDARDYKNETRYAKRTAYIKFDGSQAWSTRTTSGGFVLYECIPYNIKNVGTQATAQFLNNRYPWNTNLAENKTIRQVNTTISVRRDDITSLQAWYSELASNPLEIVYQLATPLENYGVVDLGSLEWTYQSGNTRFNAYQALSGLAKLPSTNNEVANILCAKYSTVSSNNTAAASYDLSVGLSTNGSIQIRDANFTDATVFKESLQDVYLLYEKENPQGFTTATLVTENGDVALANENGVLVGKCNSDVSADAGFIEGKIKLSDEDGDVYSNKIQIHVERSPQ